MRCMSVRLSSSPRFVVSKATVNRVRSRAINTRVYGSDVHYKRARNEDTMVCKWLGNTAGACLTATPALFCSSRVNVMYCVTKLLLIGLPIRRASLQSGGDAESTLVRHSQFRNVVHPQGNVCVPLCAFSRLG